MDDIVLVERFPNVSFDIDAIRNYIENEIEPNYPITWQGGKTWGGWTVLSSDGNCTSDWQYGATTYNEKGELIKAQTGYRFKDASQETQVCSGPIKEAIDKVKSLGFILRRCRITRMLPNNVGIIHSDSPKSIAHRLHIPIVTNSDARLGWQLNKNEPLKEIHMPADGSLYKIRVDIPHCIINRGSVPRTHIITDFIE